VRRPRRARGAPRRPPRSIPRGRCDATCSTPIPRRRPDKTARETDRRGISQRFGTAHPRIALDGVRRQRQVRGRQDIALEVVAGTARVPRGAAVSTPQATRQHERQDQQDRRRRDAGSEPPRTSDQSGCPTPSPGSIATQVHESRRRRQRRWIGDGRPDAERDEARC
jgi:hypothetical protein